MNPQIYYNCFIFMHLYTVYNDICNNKYLLEDSKQNVTALKLAQDPLFTFLILSFALRHILLVILT